MDLRVAADLASAKAAVTQARLNVDYAAVRAPISGRIGRRLVTAGNLVTGDTNTSMDVFVRERASPSALEKNVTERVTKGLWDVRDLEPSFERVQQGSTWQMLDFFTAYRALIGEWPQHKKLARITWPIWFYVAVTGVVVYWMISPYYV